MFGGITLKKYCLLYFPKQIWENISSLRKECNLSLSADQVTSCMIEQIGNTNRFVASVYFVPLFTAFPKKTWYTCVR